MSPSDYLLGFSLVFVRVYSMLVCLSVLRIYLRQSGLIILAVVVALSCGSLPLAFANSSLVSSSQSFVFALGQEIVLGLILGAPIAVALEAFFMAGRCCDMARGGQFGEQLSPGLGIRTSALENLALYVVMILGFSLGAYQSVVLLIHASLKAVPAGASFDDWMIVASRFDIEQLIVLSTRSIQVAVLFAAPVIILSFLVDLSAVLLSRVLSRINIVFELFPVKLGLGVMLVAIMVLYKPENFVVLLQQTSHLVFTTFR